MFGDTTSIAGKEHDLSCEATVDRLAGLDGNGVVGGSDLTRLLSRWN
jgi:hypothetical protein